MKPNTYRLTQEEIGTRYAFVIFRVFVDGISQEDTERGNVIQNLIHLEGGGKEFVIPNWDQTQVDRLTAMLAKKAEQLPAIPSAFGLASEVDPLQHRIGAAMAWGGMPKENAIYLYETPEINDGTQEYKLIVRDVPVNAFWSITVYDERGWLAKNDKGTYSINDKSALKRPDGSVLIHFGTKKAPQANVLPIMPGWNYTVRMYEPQAAILNGNWTFPKPAPF